MTLGRSGAPQRVAFDQRRPQHGLLGELRDDLQGLTLRRTPLDVRQRSLLTDFPRRLPPVGLRIAWPSPKHYDFAVPGSAILRCCLASTSLGVTFAIVVWSLFFIPVTTSDSPLIMASNPAFATSCASSFFSVPTLVSIMSARRK